jgi:LAO/AO transport system kinase
MSDLRLMIEMDQKKYDQGGWKPPILKVEAVFDKGVDEFLEAVDRHAAHLARTEGGLHFRGNREKVRQELGEMIKARLIEEVLDRLTDSGEFDRAVTSIVEGKVDPYTACENLVLPTLS